MITALVTFENSETAALLLRSIRVSVGGVSSIVPFGWAGNQVWVIRMDDPKPRPGRPRRGEDPVLEAARSVLAEGGADVKSIEHDDLTCDAFDDRLTLAREVARMPKFSLGIAKEMYFHALNGRCSHYPGGADVNLGTREAYREVEAAVETAARDAETDQEFATRLRARLQEMALEQMNAAARTESGTSAAIAGAAMARVYSEFHATVQAMLPQQTPSRGRTV